eukprot:6817145-Pyramimonas_sp.AAC.1
MEGERERDHSPRIAPHRRLLKLAECLWPRGGAPERPRVVRLFDFLPQVESGREHVHPPCPPSAGALAQRAPSIHNARFIRLSDCIPVPSPSAAHGRLGPTSCCWDAGRRCGGLADAEGTRRAEAAQADAGPQPRGGRSRTEPRA